jgi:polyhydroxybutyrate depolymerase
VPRSAALLAVLLLAGVAACADDDPAAGPSGSSTTTEAATGPSGTDGPGAGGSSSPGCELDPVPTGRTTETVTSGGAERSYLRYVPSTGEAEPRPLILDLTAYSPADLQERISGWTLPGPDGVVPADEVSAVVITPEPVGGAGDLLTWNLTDQPGWADDDLFMADLLATVGDEVCLDLDRTLVTGFAIGGVMASRLACTMADEVTMVVAVSGLDDPPDCAPARAVPILAIHGTGDRFLPYAGGVGAGAGGLPLSPETTAGLADVVARRGPVPETAAAWGERNGCTTRPSPEPPDDDGVTHASWEGCDDDATVELVTIEGGEHTWPGSTTMDDLTGLLGPVSDAVIAHDLIWERFTAVTEG